MFLSRRNTKKKKIEKNNNKNTTTTTKKPFMMESRNYSIFSVFLTKKKKVKVFLIILIGLGFLELCNGANLTDLSKTSSDISLLDSKFFVYAYVCVCFILLLFILQKLHVCWMCMFLFNYLTILLFAFGKVLVLTIYSIFILIH